MANIYDTILWLQSRATKQQFPTVLFSADTDAATDGWVSLTSVDRPEVVVTEATAEEYQAVMKGPEGHLLIEDRVNAALKRADLKCPWLVRVEEASPATQGHLHQEYPKILYRDILSPDSLAAIVRRTTRREFERSGGTVTVLAREGPVLKERKAS